MKLKPGYITARRRTVGESSVNNLQEKFEISPFLARFLAARGRDSKEEAAGFLKPSISRLPSAYRIEGIETAGSILAEAIKNRQVIDLIVSSRQVENFPAALILEQTLQKIGAQVNRINCNFQNEMELSDCSSEASILLFVGEMLQPEPTPGEREILLLTAENLEVDQKAVNYRPITPPAPVSAGTCGLAFWLSEVLLRAYYKQVPPDFVAVDLETTGKNPRRSEIIEIGALKFKRGQPVEEFETFVGSVDSVPGKVEEITGISGDDLSSAPPPEKALGDFVDFCGDSVLVAHNAGFDIPFLRHHGKKYLGQRFNFEFEDSMRQAQSSLPGLPGYGLKTVADHLGITLDQHHRALADARASGLIYSRIKEKGSRRIIDRLEQLYPLVALGIELSNRRLNLNNRCFYRKGLEVIAENNPLWTVEVKKKLPSYNNSFETGIPRPVTRRLVRWAGRGEWKKLSQLLSTADSDLAFYLAGRLFETKKLYYPEIELDFAGGGIVGTVEDYTYQELRWLAGRLRGRFEVPVLLFLPRDEKQSVAVCYYEKLDFALAESVSKLVENIFTGEDWCSFEFGCSDRSKIINKFKRLIPGAGIEAESLDLNYDLEIEPGKIKEKLAKELKNTAPWGFGNSPPRVLTEGKIVNISPNAPREITLVAGDEWLSCTIPPGVSFAADPELDVRGSCLLDLEVKNGICGSQLDGVMLDFKSENKREE